jgi:hypothetical protein
MVVIDVLPILANIRQKRFIRSPMTQPIDFLTHTHTHTHIYIYANIGKNSKKLVKILPILAKIVKYWLRLCQYWQK